MFLHGPRDRAGGVALAVLVFFSSALLPGPFGVPALLVCVLLSVFHALPGSADPAEKARKAATFCLGASTSEGFCRRIRGRCSFPAGSTGCSWDPRRGGGGHDGYFNRKGDRPEEARPSISPSKTVEGAVGGLLGSVGCTVLYAHVSSPLFRRDYAAAAGAAVGIFGQAGDLFESLVQARGGA